MANRTNLTAHEFVSGIGCTGKPVNSADCNTAGISLLRFCFQNGTDLTAAIDDHIKNVPNFRMMPFINAYQWESPTFAAQTAIIDKYAANVVAIEGPNETNAQNTENFADIGSNNVSPFSNEQYQGMCAGISKWLTANKNFAGGGKYIGGRKIPFVAGSLSGGNGIGDWSVAGNVGAYCDFGFIHTYPVQQPWNGGGVDAQFNQSQVMVPGKPCISSEIGHHTNPFDGSDWITETCQAKMLLNAWCGVLASGAPFFTTYELKDQQPYVGNLNTDQMNYGMLHYDGTPKVSARAIKTIMTLLGDQTNTTFIPSSYPAVTVTGLKNTGMMGGNLLVAKSDGSFWVVVWNEPEVSTGPTGKDITPPDNFVTINFGGNYNWTIYDPLNSSSNMDGSTPQATVDAMAKNGTTPVASGSGTSISGNVLNVLGYPKLVKLSPVASTPVTPPTTTPAKESNANASITKTTDAAIVDSKGNSWTLVNSTNNLGMQIAVNGVADTTTAFVQQLLYVNKLVWQKNINNMWWSKTQPSDAWSPAAGTSVTPTQVPTTVAFNSANAVANITTLVGTLNSSMTNTTTATQTAVKKAITTLNTMITTLKNLK